MIVVRSAVFLAVVQVVAMTGASAIDLTGKWRVEYSVTNVEFVDVVQTGSTVAMTLTPVAGFTLPLTGSFNDPSLSLQVPGCTPPTCYADVQAVVLPNGNWFDGRLVAGFAPHPGILRSLASRCECFDGNLTDGDGCDAHCRIEPCFDCAGMPSVCTPTADGDACTSGSDCRSGETCAAGVCGSGVATPACFDLTGLWNVHGESELGFSQDFAMRIEQRDGVMRIINLSGGSTGPLGSIDATTGAFDVKSPRLHLLCNVGFDHTIGTASADGLTFAANGTTSVATVMVCQPFGFTWAGTRQLPCGDGDLDSGEACDDGNVVTGDGCAADCSIEPCWTCSGDQASLCAVEFQPLCARPIQARSASLRLRQSITPARDIIAARSGKTDPMPTVNLGNPLATTGYQVCLFDRSGPTPQLLFGASVPAGGTCGGNACWRTASGGFAYRNRAAAPHGIVKLLVGGGAGEGRVLVGGRGAELNAAPAGFPPLPLPVPLELQIQNAENAAGCFAIEIPATGVTRNDPASGRFVAHGSP